MKRDEKCKGCQCYDCTYDYGLAVGFRSYLCNMCYGDGTVCSNCNDHDKFIHKDEAECPDYMEEN